MPRNKKSGAAAPETADPKAVKRRKSGVGEGTHKSHLCTAVHKDAAAFGNALPKRFRACHKEWVSTWT